MVQVNLWSGLRRLADGNQVVAVEARTLREMLEALLRLHPGLEPVIRAGVSISVDGVIVPDLNAPVTETSEIYLLQRIKGG
jgi:molybdopterin synthase sulfur carrier subunit